MPNIFYQNKIFEIFCAKKAHLPQAISQDKQDNYYDVRDIFFFPIRYFFLSYKIFFVTKFLTCVSNFVTCVSKFLICVTKFVTKNFLAHSEKYKKKKKNFLGKGEKRLGARLAWPVF